MGVGHSAGQDLPAEPDNPDSWQECRQDPNLTTPPSDGVPGNVPHGEDLSLNIGWDRFEKLVLVTAQRVLGLRGIKFRRYGVEGQAQYGIDLAGREPDGRYTVIQCKDFRNLTPSGLRAAVEKFAHGRRPFGAYQLIIVTSATTRATQLAEELGKLQDEHDDLELDLWGAEQLNDHLRYNADIVTRFWTRETATVFCTGAPPPGVPAPPSNLQEQAEKILVGPLRTSDMTPLLREADSKRSQAPAESAGLYGQLAARLHDEGFRGHALIMRRRQLDALAEAECHDDAAKLAAQLAATALLYGDRTEPRRLSQLLDTLASQAAAAETAGSAATSVHARLIRAAVGFVQDPLSSPDALVERLRAEDSEMADYRPLLVLMLTEDLLAARSEQLPELDDLIGEAIAQEEAVPGDNADAAIRLRLVRAEYDEPERRRLLKEARRHQVPGRQAALISAREARRCCLESRAEEALESWRDAVNDAIHAGLTDTAADWLYAIRALNVQYGPWTSELDEEHRLAQALHATGTGRLLDRNREPREAALSAIVSGKPLEAILEARRWLSDAVVTGSWADERDALAFMGDLYTNNREPLRAVSYYQLAGDDKKLLDLANQVGDLPLPTGSLKDAPWWVLCARAALVSAQADLLDDETAQTLLAELTDLAVRGRAGELTDSPNRSLTMQATKSACALVSRGTPEQAQAILDLLAPDVPREPNHYSFTDDVHAAACADIAAAHLEIAVAAVTRLLDLASRDVQSALKLAATKPILEFLQTTPPSQGDHPAAQTEADEYTEERIALRDRAIRLADRQLIFADAIAFWLDPNYPAVRVHAEEARDRILNRPAPIRGHASFGNALAFDSYLVTTLDDDEQAACLAKLLDIARDPSEVAQARQHALVGAGDLAKDWADDARQATFAASKPFVLGDQDGSHLDDLTGTPHPLSWAKISMGISSLRGAGLHLAVNTAVTIGQQEWTRDQAIHMLGSNELSDVHDATVVLVRLPQTVTNEVGVNLLAVHRHFGVRQAAAVLAVRQPVRHHDAAVRLAADPDVHVRRVLAAEAARAPADPSGTLATILKTLAGDVRNSVRSATVGSFRPQTHLLTP
jgi:hypothetical protein